jgi:antitoxin VapB
MKTAKIFADGRSQAVRLPKEYRLEGDEVYIKKFDSIIILIPKDDPWNSLIGSTDQFSGDVLETRK